MHGQLEEFRRDGSHYSPEVSLMFPLFQGIAPINHPYPNAFHGRPAAPPTRSFQGLNKILAVTRAQDGDSHSKNQLMFLCTSEEVVRREDQRPQLRLQQRLRDTCDPCTIKETVMISFQQAKKKIPDLLCDYFAARVFEAK